MDSPSDLQPVRLDATPAGLRPRLRVAAWAAALATAFGVALGFLLLQPVSAPWWVYADSDAPYVSSGLNLVLGTGTKFFDHPGLPLQQLVGLTLAVRHWFTGAPSTRAYVDGLLLNLDATRPYYRTLGALLFLAGVAVAFAAGRRLLGGPVAGAGAALLVLGAPDLVPMSIQYRADVALPALLLGGSLLVTAAAERRDPLLFLGAGLLAGLSLTVKLSTAPLLVGLAVAAVWRRPRGGLGGRRLRVALVRHRAAATAVAAVWVVAAVLLNAPAFPFSAPRRDVLLLLLAVGAVVAYLLLSRSLERGPFRPFYAALAAAVVGGLLLPVTVTVPDGIRMLPWVLRGLTGSGGVSEGVRPFAQNDYTLLGRFPLLFALPLVAIGVCALAAGVRRRDATLTALAASAAAAALLGAAHLVAREWYFMPAYLLAIPPSLLWLRSAPRRLALPVLAVLVLVAVLPQALHARDAARSAAQQEQVERAAATLAAQLWPGTVVLTPAGQYPLADSRWFELVQLYTVHAPLYPYRFLPLEPAAEPWAARLGLRPVLAIGSVASGRTLRFDGRSYALRQLPANGLPFARAALAP